MLLYNVLACVTAIFLLQSSQIHARRKPRGSKYSIDIFIDKLLASKKLDALVEKFAQKAVERMISLKSGSELRLSKDFAPHTNAPPKIPFNNVSYKTVVHLEETPVKNLSLKYKYFTKGAIYEPDENKNIKTKKHKVTTSTVQITAKTIDTEKEIKADSDDTDKSINLSDLESTLQETSNKSESFKHDVDTDNKKLLNKNKTVNNLKTQEEIDGSLSAENKKNAGFFSENELIENHKTNEGTDKKETKGERSEFDENLKKDRALFSDESKMENKKIKPPRRKRFHREGNRLYTFQSSSDYEEYHQELERVEKERKVFV